MGPINTLLDLFADQPRASLGLGLDRPDTGNRADSLTDPAGYAAEDLSEGTERSAPVIGLATRLHHRGARRVQPSGSPLTVDMTQVQSTRPSTGSSRAPGRTEHEGNGAFRNPWLLRAETGRPSGGAVSAGSEASVVERSGRGVVADQKVIVPE